MKHCYCLLVLFCLSYSVYAQKRFKPYTAYGIEVNIAATALPGNPEQGGRFSPPVYGPFLSDPWKIGFDVKANYDYAPFKFLGLGTGLGLTMRGGKGYGSRSANMSLYYVNIPLKLQLKAGFFWFEPAIQSNVLVGMYGTTGTGWSSEDFKRNDMNSVYLSYSLTGRFHLFRGLSLSVGRERWLTSVDM